MSRFNLAQAMRPNHVLPAKVWASTTSESELVLEETRVSHHSVRLTIRRGFDSFSVDIAIGEVPSLAHHLVERYGTVKASRIPVERIDDGP